MGKRYVEGNETDDHYSELVTAVSPARASTRLSVTHNLGEYNSVHISFGFEDNVADGQTLEELAKDLYDRAELLLQEKLLEYTSG